MVMKMFFLLHARITGTAHPVPRRPLPSAKALNPDAPRGQSGLSPLFAPSTQSHCPLFSPERSIFLIALAALTCSSCTHQIQSASQAAPHTKTHALLMRQVENAADLGESDVEARRWRQKLAANANDL